MTDSLLRHNDVRAGDRSQTCRKRGGGTIHRALARIAPCFLLLGAVALAMAGCGADASLDASGAQLESQALKGGGNVWHDQAVYPPHSMAHGKSLTGWLSCYWRVAFGDECDSTKSNVYFMPLPDDSDGVPEEEDRDGRTTYVFVGQMDVSLAANQSYVLPLVAWIAERPIGCEEESCWDPELPADSFEATATLNDRTIVTYPYDGAAPDGDRDYFTGKAKFTPEILYDPPGDTFAAAVFHQTVGFVGKPLPEGEHVVTNEAYLSLASLGLDFDIGYRNTWNITSAPEP